MHTDESINAYLTGQLLAGAAFHYDPQDRHGPLLYLIAAPLVKLLGAKTFSDLTEAQLRLTPVLVGSATILLFGAAVEFYGFLACLVAALLFAFGPLPVYYNRYFIHETLFVAVTLGLIVAGGRLQKNRSTSAAVLVGIGAALLLACKETAVLHFFALGVALATGWFLSPRTSLPPPKKIALTFAVFLVTALLLFTWFGRNWTVLADLLRAIPRFAARAGGEGHAKPFSYYFVLLDPLLLLFFLVAAGIYSALWDAVSGARRAPLLLAIYGLVIFLLYSVIPYKTPWLALNLWLPLALLSGAGVAAIWELLPQPAARWIAGIAGAAILLALAQQTKLLAFDRPADEKNPYAYAHTSEDLLGLPIQIAELARRQKLAHPRIAVVAQDAWPLPWYLRKFSYVGYWQPEQEPGTADFFITPSDVSGKLAAQLQNYRPDFFGARPNVLLILWSRAGTNAPPP